ncbi:MAG: hypothetical protein ACI89L_002225 [Phycisphaerales bacterium]|jgi:hypothetical protein
MPTAALPTRPTLTPTVVAAAVLLLAARGAMAQPGVPYEEVDPGWADASAINDSLRLVPVDLRTPTGFDRVFRLPTVVGGQMFARMDGGLTAVFPRSEYGFGQALIPAGTTWYIGALPSRVFGEPAGGGGGNRGGSVSGRVDLRVDLRADHQPALAHNTVRRARPPIRNPLMPWSGELARGARVSELLRRAARVDP